MEVIKIAIDDKSVLMLFEENVVTFLRLLRGTSVKAEWQLIAQNKNKLNYNEIQEMLASQDARP